MMATRLLGSVPRGKRLVASCEQTAAAMAAPIPGISTCLADDSVHHAGRRVLTVPDGAASGSPSRAAPRLRAAITKFATFASSASSAKDQDHGSDPDARYHREADHTLDVLFEEFERMIEEADVEDGDIELSQGVLTLKLGALGTYVINKQAPNRQLWMSSPVRYGVWSLALASHPRQLLSPPPRLPPIFHRMPFEYPTPFHPVPPPPHPKTPTHTHDAHRSGPKRFDLVNGFWVNSRSDCFLHDVLQNEMRLHVGFEVDVSPCSHCERENACLDNYDCVRTNAENEPRD